MAISSLTLHSPPHQHSSYCSLPALLQAGLHGSEDLAGQENVGTSGLLWGAHRRGAAYPPTSLCGSAGAQYRVWGHAGVSKSVIGKYLWSMSRGEGRRQCGAMCRPQYCTIWCHEGCVYTYRRYLSPETSLSLFCCLSCLAMRCKKKKNLIFWQQKELRRKVAREEKAVALDSRAASLTGPWPSVTICIYSRHRKDWRVTLRGFLIKPRQSCLNAEHFMALAIEGRKFLFIKFMGLDWKPNWNSFTNPCDKMIHLRGVGKIYFYHLYSANSSFLFSPWTTVISFVVPS